VQLFLENSVLSCFKSLENNKNAEKFKQIARKAGKIAQIVQKKCLDIFAKMYRHSGKGIDNSLTIFFCSSFG